MPGLSYGKPNSSQRAATLSISALLTLLTGGNFASLNFMVASIPIPRLGGSKSTSPRSRCCTLLAACWSLLPVSCSLLEIIVDYSTRIPQFNSETPDCAASKSFLLLACCFMGNVLTHSTYHCCHAQRQNALSSLSKVCSSLMTYVQLRNLT
jgi:hypothetical protein